jgi:predicted small secreted protein
MAMKKLVVAILTTALTSSILMLSACNTTEGAGKDLKSAGAGIEKTARDAK